MWLREHNSPNNQNLIQYLFAPFQSTMAPKTGRPSKEEIPSRNYHDLPSMVDQRTADERSKLRKKREREETREEREEEERLERKRVAQMKKVQERKWDKIMSRHDEDRKELVRKSQIALESAWQLASYDRPPISFRPPNLIPAKVRTWEEYDNDPDQVAPRQAAATSFTMLKEPGGNEIRGGFKSRRPPGWSDAQSNATSTRHLIPTPNGQSSRSPTTSYSDTGSNGHSYTFSAASSNTLQDSPNPPWLIGPRYDGGTTPEAELHAVQIRANGLATTTHPECSKNSSLRRPEHARRITPELEIQAIQLLANRSAKPTQLESLQRTTHVSELVPLSSTAIAEPMLLPFPLEYRTPIPHELSVMNAILANTLTEEQIQHRLSSNFLLIRTFQFYKEWIFHCYYVDGSFIEFGGEGNRLPSADMAIMNQAFIRRIYYALDLATSGKTFWGLDGVLRVRRPRREMRKSGRRLSVGSNATIAFSETEKREEIYVTWALEKSWTDYLVRNVLVEAEELTEEDIAKQVSLWRGLVEKYSELSHFDEFVEVKDEESKASESEDDFESEPELTTCPSFIKRSMLPVI
jgi:hypothetical protein